jgi:hypothetical protein
VTQDEIIASNLSEVEKANERIKMLEDKLASIKQAIAELESQEPVAKLKTSNVLLRCHSCGYSDKLTMQIEYTHPPQRTWVGCLDLEDSNAYLNTEEKNT